MNPLILPMYRGLGLRTFPVNPKNKKPRVTGWQKIDAGWEWEKERQYSNSSIGMLNDRIVIVDVDFDKEMRKSDYYGEERRMRERIKEMRRLFGPTPVESESKSGGRHLWYRRTDEPRIARKGKSPGIFGMDDSGRHVPIDLLGLGGFVIVPGSVGYDFVKGNLDEVPSLPPISAEARELVRVALGNPRVASAPKAPSTRQIDAMDDVVRKGTRDETRFRYALGLAAKMATIEELIEDLRRENAARYQPPLEDREVVEKAESAWNYKVTGKLFTDRPGVGIYRDEREKLLHHADALMLLLDLRDLHAWNRDGEFTLADATRNRYGWTRPRFKEALETLLDLDFLEVTHKGGRGNHDARRARLIQP